jgi:hypothetical protein
MRIRYIKNSAIVPRSNMLEEIAYLESNPNYVRVSELTWVSLGKAMELSKYLGEHAGKTALIIGKGPSLDFLTKDMITEDMVVFACNEAIKKIESFGLPSVVYACQLDITLGFIKSRCPHIVSHSILHLYNQYDTTIAVTRMHGLLTPVGRLACVAARAMGCQSVILTGFDGAYGGNTEYAKTIGYSARRGGSLDRFRLHGAYIESALVGIEHKHVALNKDFIGLCSQF